VNHNTVIISNKMTVTVTVSFLVIIFLTDFVKYVQYEKPAICVCCNFLALICSVFTGSSVRISLPVCGHMWFKEEH